MIEARKNTRPMTEEEFQNEMAKWTDADFEFINDLVKDSEMEQQRRKDNQYDPGLMGELI